MNKETQASTIIDNYEQKLQKQLEEIQAKLSLIKDIKRETILTELMSRPWASWVQPPYGLSTGEIKPLSPEDINKFGVLTPNSSYI